MKQESDHSPLLWSVVIAIFGLAAIAFFIIAGNAKKQEISFSCSSEFTSILDIQNTKKELHGIMLITSYNSGHLSLSVQGNSKVTTASSLLTENCSFAMPVHSAIPQAFLCSLPMVGKNPPMMTQRTLSTISSSTLTNVPTSCIC